MKNIIKITVAIFFLGMISCDYLDVVPNDAPDLHHAFSNRSVAEKFLRTCYSHLPDITDPFFYPTWFTSRDEVICDGDSRSNRSAAAMIADGAQNTNDPYQNYWTGINGGKPLYVAIRDCNIFLNNIHIPQDIQEEERSRWIGEVKFLKAYYHFFLLQLYGPIVIADEEEPLSATPEELQVYREPVDVCVDYIANLLDEAILLLPPSLPDINTELGRIDQIIAMSVKAKLLTLAASPLFNGNTDYREWVDNRGLQLISDTYDRSKWERAAEAIKIAIETAHNNGKQLYKFNKYATAGAYNMNDTLVQIMTIRKTITEEPERNPEVIWVSMDISADGKGNAAGLGYHILGNLLKQFFPYMYVEDYQSYVGLHQASWHMVELFYSNNGVPINEDKDYNYANRFNVRRATPGDNHQSYIATGETTAEIHYNREPRFYASLAFDRGFVELASATEDGGATFSPFMRWRNGEVHTHGKYQAKKVTPYESSASQGNPDYRYTPRNYFFPMIRLADLYLLYSEALNEVKEEPDAEVHYWINLVREKAGLKGVAESWEEHSNTPDKPWNKIGMRDIIQQERLIELAFEAQRSWDVRRWKLAERYWSLPSVRWSVSEKEAEAFYVPVTYKEGRSVTFRDYLQPIRNYDLRINSNLVQTYGWQ
ncbi:MAG: RagB/SusD family nutrient uptake outer membrane protein [Proteiniphilum sp.]